MAVVEIRDAVRKYGTVLLHGVDLDVADGEFVVLVGPSGCVAVFRERLQVMRGARLNVLPDRERAHLFDAASGRRITLQARCEIG